ncbi:MAG: VWA domain-containing protein [Acidobacteria bacterium]|nr:VWA domain-containing protein [Acidobacteriota bacterium]
MWRLANPVYLLLLVFPFALLAWHVYGSRRGRSSLLFSGGHLLQELPRTWRTVVSPHTHWLRYPGLILLVLALTRPQTGQAIEEVETFGVDIMMVLDVSATMGERDMVDGNREVSRLLAAKKEMAKFIQGRSSDRIGLIAFATQSLTRCPLTTDYDLVNLALDEIDLNLFPQDMRRTAIGNAIATGVSRLWKSDARSKVIILLTDGDNTAGNVAPVTAAEIAKDESIRVHTIGFGSVGRTDVNEDLLRTIADTTGGKYFRSNSLEDLQQVYDLIDELEKSEVVVKNYQSWDEWFPWFLWPGCGLILFEIAIRHLLCRRVP